MTTERVAIVTAGGSGNGAACARELAAQGSFGCGDEAGSGG
jgi:NAD(P)-dependent dehydrogenase (short-subunit alcohol dehydrogenase family)